MNAPWYERAKREVGVHEVAGDGNNPVILQYAKDAKIPGYTADSIPWCSVFECAMYEREGIRSIRSAWARDNLSWGVKLDEPREGCSVILDRGRGYGHVTFFARFNEDRTKFLGLGGNQSDGVTYAWFSVDKVLGYRWPVIPDKKDVARKLRDAGSRTIEATDNVKNLAKVAAGGGVLVNAVNEVTDAPVQTPIDTVKDVVAQGQDIRSLVEQVHDLTTWCLSNWQLFALISLAVVVYYAHKIEQARVDDHITGKNTGRLLEDEPV